SPPLPQIGKAHPDPVVENTSLAAVQPPDVSYVPHLPESALEHLSEVQMESVVYAGHQFEEEPLPNGDRRG
ncbi:unnamed protein product, partial [Laminaria digitata]